jgi:transketolase
MQEGQIWEAGLSAAHKKLNNLTAILDYNKAQIDGHTAEVLNLDPITDKWRAFGWHVHEIDGHNYAEITKALKDTHPEKPTMIIAHTVKGKGVSFMENQVGWHGKAPSAEETTLACQELEQQTSIGL